MGRDTFLLAFASGAALLAVWVALERPRLAPASFRRAWAHVAVALLVGALLGPSLHAVPGLPSPLSVMAALFLVALPAMTYMLLVGIWLVQLTIGETVAPRR
jgi:hypothetical protein